MLDERDKNQGWAGQGFFPRGGARVKIFGAGRGGAKQGSKSSGAEAGQNVSKSI